MTFPPELFIPIVVAKSQLIYLYRLKELPSNNQKLQFINGGTTSKVTNEYSKLTTNTTTTITASTMGENSLSSVEEVISIDDCAAGSSYSTIPFSKKAIHQRDADENLFLRFLELDPLPDSTTASTTSGTTTTITNTIANSGSGSVTAAALLAEQRKKAYVRPSNGRTPFTITKKLVRDNDNRGYGFSIVWTHPPRVEKVEPGLTAEKCGILPGDFVIFVDKHNVVTMPELDILNLIKSQGNTLLLEIYRRSTTKPSNGLKSRNSVTISSNQMMVDQATPKQ